MPFSKPLFSNCLIAGGGDVLLIDSGARVKGYCSDITRTYVTKNVPEAFRKIVIGMDELQKVMCDRVRSGTSMQALQAEATEMIAELLLQTKILKGITAKETMSPEKRAIVRAFYPHGLGLMLGIQVHDVSGRQLTLDGKTQYPDVPNLRASRELHPGHVVTVEPGIYFIDFSLDDHRNRKHQAHFNWPLIDELRPYDGVRIEDNMLVTEEGHRNITRPHLDLPIEN